MLWEDMIVQMWYLVIYDQVVDFLWCVYGFDGLICVLYVGLEGMELFVWEVFYVCDVFLQDYQVVFGVSLVVCEMEM